MQLNRRHSNLGRILLAAAALLACAAMARTAAAEEHKPLTEWYYADALAIPLDGKDMSAHGSLGCSLEWISVFNLSNQETKVTVTFYLEDEAPRQLPMTLPPQQKRTLDVHGKIFPGEQLHGKLFGVRVQSPTPVVVQAVRAEQEFDTNQPTMPGRSFLSRIGHPGPLGKAETAWAYADAVVQLHNKNAKEWEWLTVLNPNPGKDAHIKVTFNTSKGKVKYDFDVAAERVKCVSLQEIDGLPEHSSFAVLVESDVPVIVEQVRRFSFRWHPAPAGTYVVMAQPVGDLGIELPSAK